MKSTNGSRNRDALSFGLVLLLLGLMTPASLLMLIQPTSGFSPAAYRTRVICPRQQPWSLPSSALEARKKRRRKTPPLSDSSAASKTDGEELPDFDLDDLDGADSVASEESPVAKGRSTTIDMGGASKDPLGEISANMMGSSDRPARSVNELLSDRSLESKLQFDIGGTEDGEELPDLAALSKQRLEEERQTGLPSPTSKKRARQEARKAAAMAAAAEEEEVNILEKLPFIRDESGKISPIKILENGTWACIGALVLWEIFINSPFFDRAAPMVPVVYEFFI